MSTYVKEVQRNLDAMNTKAFDWTVAELAPDNFLPAPTIFPASNLGSGFTTCELCGHKIKHIFTIIHNARKMFLVIGSECVRHFGTGASGEEFSKEAKWNENREWLIETMNKYETDFQRRKAYNKRFGKSDVNGYSASRDLGYALRKMLQKSRANIEIKNGSITMFRSNSGKHIDTLLQKLS